MASRLWRPRFSLRTGAALLLTICVAFGFAARWYHDVRARGEGQLKLIQRLRSEKGFYQIDEAVSMQYANEAEVDSLTRFARRWAHSEYNRKFHRVTIRFEINQQQPPYDLRELFGVENLTFHYPPSAKTLAQAFEIPGLKEMQAGLREDNLQNLRGVDWTSVHKANQLESLRLSGAQLGESLARELGQLPSLAELNVFACTPKEFSEIAKAPRLKTLWCRITTPLTFDSHVDSPGLIDRRRDFGIGFDALAQNSNLIKLRIRGDLPVTRTELVHFCANSKVEELWLDQIEIDPNCLIEIAKLANLKILEILSPTLTIHSLEP